MVYVERAGNGLAVAALVCGIVGAVFGLIPLVFVLAFILGILGILGSNRDTCGNSVTARRDHGSFSHPAGTS